MATCMDNSANKCFFFTSSDHHHHQIDLSRPIFPSASSSPLITAIDVSDSHSDQEEHHNMWSRIREEAQFDSDQEPILRPYYYSTILSHPSLQSALSTLLASKLTPPTLPTTVLRDVFFTTLISDAQIMKSVIEDIRAVEERDPACISMVHCVLNFKGFHALVAHRIAHKLWSQKRLSLALLIQNRVSEVLAVDIHPAAKMGRGVMLDHGTGVVIGETAEVGSHVAIMHGVTLGGTGKESGDRHPKIGDGVLVGAGSCVLGRVKVGEGAKIGAGSVVLVKEVPPRTTVVGIPGRLIGGQRCPKKLDKVPSETMDQTSFVSEWSDYVI